MLVTFYKTRKMGQLCSEKVRWYMQSCRFSITMWRAS